MHDVFHILLLGFPHFHASILYNHVNSFALAMLAVKRALNWYVTCVQICAMRRRRARVGFKGYHLNIVFDGHGS